MGCLLAIFAVVVTLVAAMAAAVLMVGAWPGAVVLGLMLAIFVAWVWDERDAYWPVPAPEPWVRSRELSPVGMVAVPEPGLDWTGVSLSGTSEDRVAVLAYAEWRDHLSDCPACMAAYWLDGERCRVGRELCA
jgi:hypothetical protein